MQPESDDHLVRYLLGELPEDESEPLDERSITDDALALRLREIENDLVDRYARGEPLAVQRLSKRLHESTHLRDKAQFATALHRLSGASHRAPVNLPSNVATRRRWVPGLPVAALLLLAVAGYLGVRTMQLRGELDRVDAERGAAERRNGELQRELGRARPVPQSTVAAPVFVIPAPRRGIEIGETTVAIPRGSSDVILRLIVESDAYRSFWSSVRDPLTNRVIWRSADLPSAPDGANRIVTLTVPTASLQSGRLFAELSGVLPDGSVELVATYPIRIVLE